MALTPAIAGAQDDESSGQIYAARAVQNRVHQGDHELTVAVGALPLDAFTKGLTLSGAYTIHFSELIGWEIVQFYHSFPLGTDLKDQLASFELEPTPFEVVEDFVTTNLVIKPVYWKGALLNDELIYGEIFFVLGGGYGFFTRSERAAVDFGMGLKLYTGPVFSFRLDLRHVSFFRDSIFDDFDLENEIWIGLGISLTL